MFDALLFHVLFYKAVQLEPKYAESFRIKGSMCLKRSNFELALIAFSQANSLEKDMTSFSGIIEANIELGKLKDAVLAAKESIAMFPKSSAAHFAMGYTLSKSTQISAQIESIRSCQKALQLNPMNTSAVTCLAEALSLQGRHDEAVDCLNRILDQKAEYKLRFLLAKLYTNAGKFADAIQNLQLSMGLNLNSEDTIEATTELARVEQLMRDANEAVNAAAAAMAASTSGSSSVIGGNDDQHLGWESS